MSTYLDLLKDYILTIYNNQNTTLAMQQEIFDELKRLTNKLSELNELIGNIPIQITK